MEVLFKCRFEWTADDTKAIYYRTMKRTRKIKISVITLVLSFIACAAVVFLQENMPLKYLGGGLMCIIILGIISVFLKHSRYAKREYEYILKCNGGKAPELFIEVSENSISSKNKNGEGGKTAFNSITHAAEDKQRFMLTSSNGKHFIIKKDSFTQGTAEEFKEFLREKELII